MDGTEEGTAVVFAVPRHFKIFSNQSTRRRMQRHIARLAALAGDFQVGDAAPLVLKVFDFQLAEFVSKRVARPPRIS